MSEISPAGYYRHLLDLYQGASGVNLNLDEDEPFDASADAPWAVVNSVEYSR